MSTHLENRERERQRKGDGEATGQRSSTRKRATERERKNKGDIFCWRNIMKFCSGGEKMRNGRTRRKFLEVSRCGRAKQRQRNVQKSVLHVQSCFFAIVVFSPFSLPSPLKVMLYETIRHDDF